MFLVTSAQTYSSFCKSVFVGVYPWLLSLAAGLGWRVGVPRSLWVAHGRPWSPKVVPKKWSPMAVAVRRYGNRWKVVEGGGSRWKVIFLSSRSAQPGADALSHSR